MCKRKYCKKIKEFFTSRRCFTLSGLVQLSCFICVMLNVWSFVFLRDGMELVGILGNRPYGHVCVCVGGLGCGAGPVYSRFSTDMTSDCWHTKHDEWQNVHKREHEDALSLAMWEVDVCVWGVLGWRADSRTHMLGAHILVQIKVAAFKRQCRWTDHHTHRHRV